MVIVAIVLGKAGGNYRSYDEVFAFVNPTGWPDEIASCIGMLFAAYWCVSFLRLLSRLVLIPLNVELGVVALEADQHSPFPLRSPSVTEPWTPRFISARK